MDACLGVEPVFGTDLPSHPAFRAAVGQALGGLLEAGAARTVAAHDR